MHNTITIRRTALGFGMALTLVLAFAVGYWQARMAQIPASPVDHFFEAGGDIERFEDIADFVARSELVIIADVASQTEIKPIGSEIGADFYQTARVTRVIRGDAVKAGDVIRLVRNGYMPGYNIVSDHGAVLPGPFKPGPSLLFLHRSGADGVWEATGLTQGEMPMKNGRVGQAYGPFAHRDFEGLDGEAVERRVREIERGR